MKDKTKILLLRTGAIGDVILTFPLVLACIEKYGQENVTFAGPERMRSIAFLCSIQHYTDIDTCGLHMMFASSFDPETTPPVFKSYDIIINLLTDENGDLHKNLASICNHVYSLASPDDSTDMHAAEYLMRVMPDPPDAIPQPCIHETKFENIPDAVSSIFKDRPTVTIHPGTGSPGKLIDMTLFEQLIRNKASDHSVILLTGPADKDLVSFCENQVKQQGCFHFHSLPLDQTAYIISRSDEYYGLDSGISHLAGLTGTPLRVIFTSTDPDIWKPYAENTRVITLEEFEEDLIVDE
jgi:ADP-heptose:LPS heptosyltransferase